MTGMSSRQQGAALPLLFALAATLFESVLASAQSAQVPPSAATHSITTRKLAAAIATSSEVLGSLAAVRQLPNGNVLVNDQARHRVLLLDKNLALVSIVADSTSSTNNAYGVQPGGLIPFRGDSTLFVDAASLSMLVIDPAGKLTRTMAAPRPNDTRYLTGGALGNPGFDAKGRLVYRTVDFGFGRGRGVGTQPGQAFVMPTPPDSAALVRFDLATRKLDTAGFFKIAKTNTSMSEAGGHAHAENLINPLPVVDDWAVMSDGTIALVRGRDYHIDFIEPSGAISSAEKIPYDWQRLRDEDKQAFLDSSRVALEKLRARDPQAVASSSPTNADPLGSVPAPGFSFGGGGDSHGAGDGFRSQFGGGAPRPRDGGGDSATPRAEGSASPAAISMVPASTLPDYKPVFGPGAVRADADNRIWVRTIATKATSGGAIYEVIDRSGKLVERVQIPAGRAIAGFGKGGVVYLGYRDAAGVHLEKAIAP